MQSKTHGGSFLFARKFLINKNGVIEVYGINFLSVASLDRKKERAYNFKEND